MKWLLTTECTNISPRNIKDTLHIEGNQAWENSIFLLLIVFPCSLVHIFKLQTEINSTFLRGLLLVVDYYISAALVRICTCMHKTTAFMFIDSRCHPEHIEYHQISSLELNRR